MTVLDLEPVVTTDGLEDLAPPCEGPCDPTRDATWWLRLEMHDCDGVEGDEQLVLLCGDCKVLAMETNFGAPCTLCNTWIRISDVLIDFGKI